MMNHVSEVTYGRTVAVSLPFDAAVDRTKEALKAEGFGVLCEIDIAAAMREKLGKAFRPYRILGACNPTLAYQALDAEPQLGLLLPCNVIVQEVDGATMVSAVDAQTMLGVVHNPRLEPIAKEADARLHRVLAALA